LIFRRSWLGRYGCFDKRVPGGLPTHDRSVLWSIGFGPMGPGPAVFDNRIVRRFSS
jgi:hypothetical protein